MDTDVLVVGTGLAGLVAAAEVADAGKRAIMLDQEPEVSLGGQAFWSLGGLFMVDTPEQRLMGVRDSLDLALQDWFGSARFDRPQDHWPRRWAEAYVNFAAGEKCSWLRQMGHRVFPVVGWAERGDGRADGHGNSVPRFHITWGTGPGVVAPFERRVREHEAAGRIDLRFRHRVDALVTQDGAVTGVSGKVLEPSSIERGQPSSRLEVADFELTAQTVIVTSGGIGGNHDLVRKAWPERLGPPPRRMVAGVPAHVDGRMLGITEAVGGNIINSDRMWHYTEGLHNWDPVWANHGIRILPGPSSLWLDAEGSRLPAPYFPGFDTLGTLRHLMSTGYDYSWFVLTQKIIEREFALSGSEQNPDLTGKDLRLLLQRIRPGAPGPVEAFKLWRTATPHKLLDPRAGPLIAVRLNILTRKTLGGLETDLEGRVLTSGGEPLPGLFAAGEVSGFGGGGMHGYNSLEGTFLGGCLFSGRSAGRSAASSVA